MRTRKFTGGQIGLALHQAGQPSAGRRLIGVMGMLATFIALTSCSSGSSESSGSDWSIHASGISPGAIAEVEVTGGSIGVRSVLLEAGRLASLKALKPGTYDITLKDVQFNGRTWTPRESALKVSLESNGTALNLKTGRSISSAPYQLRLTFDASAGTPGATIAEPVFMRMGSGSNGLFYLCDSTSAGSCAVVDNLVPKGGAGTPRLHAKGNDRVYVVSLNKIFSCTLDVDPANPDNSACSYLDDAGGDESGSTAIISLIYANNSLYAGLKSGIMWRCDPNAVDSCTSFNDAGNLGGFLSGPNSVLSLAFGDGRLFAGLRSGLLWSCDPDTPDRCQYLDQAGGPITALTYGNGSIYAGIDDQPGTLWRCDPAKLDSCIDIYSVGGDYYNLRWAELIYANDRIYGLGGSGGEDGWINSKYAAVFSCDSIDGRNTCVKIWEPKTYCGSTARTDYLSCYGYNVNGMQYVSGKLFFTKRASWKSVDVSQSSVCTDGNRSASACYTCDTALVTLTEEKPHDRDVDNYDGYFWAERDYLGYCDSGTMPKYMQSAEWSWNP